MSVINFLLIFMIEIDNSIIITVNFKIFINDKIQLCFIFYVIHFYNLYLMVTHQNNCLGPYYVNN